MKPGTDSSNPHEHCLGCVYFPANLPEQAYSAEDFLMLQRKSCSFDFMPQDESCRAMRKTSCSLLDLTP